VWWRKPSRARPSARPASAHCESVGTGVAAIAAGAEDVAAFVVGAPSVL
jgi:hypothetical protein